MFEYSGPNTHKAFHVGHLRNTLLGAALVRLSRSQGNLVLAANYINDVGSHVAKVLWYLEKNPTSQKQPMGEVYARANGQLTEQPEFEGEVAAMMQRLEEVLPPNLPKTSAQRQLKKLWEQTRQQSLTEFKKWYELLGVKFQIYFFEKDIKLRSKGMVDDLLAKGLAKKSEGAVIVDLNEENLGVLLILRSNGTALYATSDLVLAQEKFRRFKIDRSVYLTDSRQSFYFQQLFTVLKKWGFSEELTHVPYEFVTVNGKVLASRAGQTMTLAEVWQRAVDLALGQTRQRHNAWSEKKIKRTAEGLALAVLDFEMLKTSPRNKIDFDLEKALSFEGFTGPYLLYTIARINSIFSKAKPRFLGLAQVQLLQAPSEVALLKSLASYPEILQQANQEMNPAMVAQYLFNLAKQFAAFYEQEPVLTAPAPLRKARLYLLSGVRQVMHNGLEILGIKALPEM
jgi:arginyl-tRNA synthetase